ncbi:MAG TPA: hypothetical protein VLU46_16215, partial [Thermoanaerobaculia bacterium]|nr:hypothetical protein [Thermoanaerobaculia bacterium]
MKPAYLFVAIAALFAFALPVAAQTSNFCNLQITINCQQSGSVDTCTSTTLNAGATACTGEFFSGIFSVGSTPGQVSAFHNSLGLSECFDDSTFPGPTGETYAFCMGPASLAAGATFTASANVTGAGGVFAVTEVIDVAGNYSVV